MQEKLPTNEKASTTHKQHMNWGLKTKKIIKNASKSRFTLAVIIVVIAAVPTLYFYQKSKEAEQKLNNPTEANKKVVDEVEKKVAAHYMIPTDEQPTLVTITDVAKVKGQQFFDRAENGDKILVYTQARKAILYRQSKDVIVEVAPLNVDSIQSAAGTQK